MSKKVVIIYLIFIAWMVHSRQADEDYEVEQVKIGNLALPGSQQPGSFFGFGQNIVDRGDLQAVCSLDSLFGCRRNFTELSPGFLYGIRDELSLFIEIPIAVHFKADSAHSSGIGDIMAQLEYSLYIKEEEIYTNEVTLVTSCLLPTGDACKEPSTGFGSPSFFIGLTAYHIATDWYYYASPGVLLTTKYGNHTKMGNQFLYECGIGKNIAYKADKWIVMWMIELIGIYEQRNTINGSIDNESGGNTVILAPSLWFSTDRIILQGSIAPIISQDSCGDQPKDWFIFSLYFSWKFN